ncbi:unnamed protein product [Sympodiomycopsis kandeliae]
MLTRVTRLTSTDTWQLLEYLSELKTCAMKDSAFSLSWEAQEGNKRVFIFKRHDDDYLNGDSTLEQKMV